MNAPVTTYLPELEQTGWRGATLQQVLDMTTGTRFSEEYTNPYSDIGQIGCGLGLETGSARQRCQFQVAAPYLGADHRP